MATFDISEGLVVTLIRCNTIMKNKKGVAETMLK